MKFCMQFNNNNCTPWESPGISSETKLVFLSNPMMKLYLVQSGCFWIVWICAPAHKQYAKINRAKRSSWHTYSEIQLHFGVKSKSTKTKIKSYLHQIRHTRIIIIMRNDSLQTYKRNCTIFSNLSKKRQEWNQLILNVLKMRKKNLLSFIQS